MKKNLVVKIMLVVLGIALTTTIFYGSITSYLTAKSFSTYLEREKGAREESLAEWAAISYSSIGWDLVYYLRPTGGRGGRGMMMHGTPLNQERIIIADQTGTVRYDSEGLKELLSPDELVQATPIVVAAKTIGYVTIETPATSKIAVLRESFTTSLKTVSWISSAFAALLALLFGFILSYDLIKRIKLLNNATTRLINGDLETSVPVIGDDELAQLAEAFNKMVLKLAANNRARQNLFNDVAHELRTPLSILRGNLEAMQLGVVEPTTARIASLNDELIRLTSLVRELQEIGLAEAGELQLNLATENLADLLSDLKLIFEPEAEAKGIQLNFSYPNLQINVDKNRLRQVLINIISNALRYTENGLIELKVDELADNLLFTLTNTGPQILEDDLEHLFDRFYKADASRTRGKSGSGLGLAIAKAYVEAHEGQISVRNVSDGVQFSFSISKNIVKNSHVTSDN